VISNAIDETRIAPSVDIRS